MARKKTEADDIELVPEAEFEDAFRSILNAPKERVAEQIEEMHAANVEKRTRKKPTKK